MAESKVVSLWHRFIRAVGFQKPYNFILFFIFGGGLFGFTLSRLEFLNINKFRDDSAPGEWYYFRQSLYKTGIMMHLVTILPCSILAVLQFVPVIRHKATMFHRLNGYLVILLFLISNAGALIILPHGFGGDPGMQFGNGLLVFCSTFAIILAYINIRRKQIEQHRAWMLRGMFYMGSIVTMRPLLEILKPIFRSLTREYYVSWPCDQIDYTWKFYDLPTSYTSAYPMCNVTSTLPPEVTGTQIWAPVKADLNAPDPAAIGASFQLQFVLSSTLAIFLHFVGIEVYLRLTPREHARLRNVSYERQVAKKYKNPGSGGLVVQKVGDADPWFAPEPKADGEGSYEKG